MSKHSLLSNTAIYCVPNSEFLSYSDFFIFYFYFICLYFLLIFLLLFLLFYLFKYSIHFNSNIGVENIDTMKSPSSSLIVQWRFQKLHLGPILCG